MTRTVYALAASDEPLQVRYVGATTQSLQKRLARHPYDKVNIRKTKWFHDVKARGATVNIRALSEHTSDNGLFNAERRWLAFWKEYCDVLNMDLHCRSGGSRTIKPEIVRTTIPLHELVRRIRAMD